MNKQFKSLLAIWVIAIVVVITAFIIAEVIVGSALFSFIIVAAAFAAFLVIAWSVFKREESTKFFYGWSVLKLGKALLVVITILGVASVFVPSPYKWIGAGVCLLVTALYAIAIIKANAAGEIVGQKDDEIQEKTFFIKMFRANCDTLLSEAKSEEIRAELQKVSDAARFSDPMNNPSLSYIEEAISAKLNELAVRVRDNDVEKVKTAVAELLTLIKDRNNKCKVLK